MPEAAKYTYRIELGSTPQEFVGFLKQAAPLVAAWWEEAKPERCGEFFVYAPTDEGMIVPGMKSFFQRLVDRDIVFASVYDGAELIGLCAGGMFQHMWCKNLIAHMHLGYIKPERRGGSIAKRAGDLLAGYFYDKGADYVFYDIPLSREPYAQRTIEWKVRDGRQRR